MIKSGEKSPSPEGENWVENDLGIVRGSGKGIGE